MIRLLKSRTLNQALEQPLLQKQYMIEMSRSSYFVGKIDKISNESETKIYDQPPRATRRDMEPRRAMTASYKYEDRLFPGHRCTSKAVMVL